MAKRINVYGTISLDSETWKRLDAYRARRRQERGKSMTTATAMSELLETALSGIEPPKLLEDRLAGMERRIAELEQRT